MSLLAEYEIVSENLVCVNQLFTDSFSFFLFFLFFIF